MNAVSGRVFRQEEGQVFGVFLRYPLKFYVIENVTLVRVGIG